MFSLFRPVAVLRDRKAGKLQARKFTLEETEKVIIDLELGSSKLVLFAVLHIPVDLHVLSVYGEEPSLPLNRN